ncbi:MAG TPA: hypothetical protein DGT23_19565, partial [Micromonosporaceae bacterium]|nr:hypothetical protein [Micromonosporaceae bacterium]
MIWLETDRHAPDQACRNHCHSCDLDHPGHAWRWCLECGHGYRNHHELKAAYLAEAPYSRWSWRWWRILLLPWPTRSEE